MPRPTYDDLMTQTEPLFSGTGNLEWQVQDAEYLSLLERYQKTTGSVKVTVGAELRAQASRMQALPCSFQGLW